MQVIYSSDALHYLDSLPKVVRGRIISKITFYARQSSLLQFAKKLSGYEAYRLRVGEYRVVCDMRDGTLCVLFIAKRDDAYRSL